MESECCKKPNVVQMRAEKKDVFDSTIHVLFLFYSVLANCVVTQKSLSSIIS